MNPLAHGKQTTPTVRAVVDFAGSFNGGETSEDLVWGTYFFPGIADCSVVFWCHYLRSMNRNEMTRVASTWLYDWRLSIGNLAPMSVSLYPPRSCIGVQLVAGIHSEWLTDHLDPFDESQLLVLHLTSIALHATFVHCRMLFKLIYI